MGFSRCQAPLISHSSHAHSARPRSLFAKKYGIANFEHCTDKTTAHENFSGEYATSKKTPDLAWTPCIDNTPNDYPSVVLESGYSESDAQLMRDSLVWLQGTDGAVKVVVLCKTFPPSKDNKIKATLSIFRRMHNGQIIRDQWVIYFPFHQRALYLESNLVFLNLVCLPHSGR